MNVMADITNWLKPQSHQPKMLLPMEAKIRPTAYQQAFRRAIFLQKKKRLIKLWHRRAGKDLDTFESMVEFGLYRKGTLIHCLPELKQARKIVWEGMDDGGIPFIKRIPDRLVARNKMGQPDKNEAEMRVRLRNGSIIQLVGADKFDTSLVGTNCIWATFSEYPIGHPQAWELTRPILRANGGVAVFCYTPRGKNHGYKLWEIANKQLLKKNETPWWAQMLTIEDTARERMKYGAAGPFTREDVDLEIEEGMDPDLAEQEYYCSFDGPLAGTFYSDQYKRMVAKGQVGNVPFDPKLPVYTYWDLGVNDQMTILFMQETGTTSRLIDFYENNENGLDHYAYIIKNRAAENGYIYTKHVAPHDAKVREMTSRGMSRASVMSELGVRWDVQDRPESFREGVAQVRLNIPRLWIDELKCHKVIESIREYKRKYNRTTMEYTEESVHDEHSHRVDPLRLWAEAGYIGRPGDIDGDEPLRVISDFNPITGEVRGATERDYDDGFTEGYL